jgi:hypothetical protein
MTSQPAVPPDISVIMATFNGASTLRASINSVLSQTCRNFELIVADDGSTDDTAAMLASYDDARLKILPKSRNLGIVASRNRCLEAASGALVAMLDHDDLSAPTRLARQSAYLQSHPGTVLVGTAARSMQNGVLSTMNHPAVTTPGLIGWLLNIVNPLICSSVMFRRDAAVRLGSFMRERYIFADDYDFYHRIAAFGDIARLDEPLTIYRLHPGNTFKKHERAMTANAARVLEPSYRKFFGEDALQAANLVVMHLSAGWAVPDEATLSRLRDIFQTINTAALEKPGCDAKTRDLLEAHAAALWRRMLGAAARQSTIPRATLLKYRIGAFQPSAADRATIALDRMPFRAKARDAVRAFGGMQHALIRRLNTAFVEPSNRHSQYETLAPLRDQAPTMFVVVDTEAEFDWAKPFARNLTDVTAMDNIERGQAVFDLYGLRPIYVIDYPVATQERGFRHLREIMQRDGCEIGAHLHPWTNPPFEEELSVRNSYPGNLPAWLESQKLGVLIDAITQNFGKRPQFYRAGRYGFGPASAQALAEHGIRVDLSVLPGADLRAGGGPDFRGLAPVPYRLRGTPILSLPMSRATVGLMPPLSAAARALHASPAGSWLHAPSMLARFRVAETITLTPEGVTAAEQIRLLRTMLKRGTRLFVLHYHSPSLVPGHTQYVRDNSDVDRFLARLQEVCRFFFDELGGLPGYPRDLLQMQELSAG